MATVESIVKTVSQNGKRVKAINYSDVSQGSKTYEKTFRMMNDVLSGVEAVLAVSGSSPSIPNVDNSFEAGSDEHAHEVCATMTQIYDDIFAASDNGLTFIAVGSEAENHYVARILQKCDGYNPDELELN